jgi:hypothetical protein
MLIVLAKSRSFHFMKWDQDIPLWGANRSTRARVDLSPGQLWPIKPNPISCSKKVATKKFRFDVFDIHQSRLWLRLSGLQVDHRLESDRRHQWGRQRGRGRRPAPARSDQHIDGKRLSRRFPAIRSARVHGAFDGKRIFGGDLVHTTLDDILVLFFLDGYRL